MNSLLSKVLHVLGTVVVGTSSVVAPDSMNAEPADPDKVRKRPSEQDIIGSEDFHNAKYWEQIRPIDSHVYRYTKLDELIDFAEDHKSGRRWDKIRYHAALDEKPPHLQLFGTRSDGETFTVKSLPISEPDDIHAVFDDLCERLNAKLGVER